MKRYAKSGRRLRTPLSGEFDAASILIVPLLPAAHRLSENTIELGDMSATNAFCLTFELGFHFERWVKGVQDWAVWNGVQIAEPVSLAKDRFPPMPNPSSGTDCCHGWT